MFKYLLFVYYFESNFSTNITAETSEPNEYTISSSKNLYSTFAFQIKYNICKYWIVKNSIFNNKNNWCNIFNTYFSNWNNYCNLSFVIFYWSDQFQPYYEMENNYEKSYDKGNNRDHKSKDSSSRCINSNINTNGNNT